MAERAKVPELLKTRIVGRGMVEASKLKPHPMNFRLHPEPQRKAVEAILDQVGWVEDALVNKRTGLMLDGHLRREIVLARNPLEKIPVTYVDLSPAEEKLILAALDSTGAMAIVDDEQLASLLAEAPEMDADLSAMLEGLLGDSQLMTPKEGKAPAPAVPNDKAPRQMGDRKTQIKPVLYAPQVAIFEEALRATGEANRGKALVEICDFYVKANAK